MHYHGCKDISTVGGSIDQAEGAGPSLRNQARDESDAAVGDKGKKEIRHLRLGVGVASAIHRHAEALYPEEVCGGLLGRRDGSGHSLVSAALPVINTRSTERRRRYLIRGADVLWLERCASDLGLEVVGYYHSHPDAPAVPSEVDREHAWPWYVYLIVSVTPEGPARIRAWRLARERGVFVPVEVCSGSE